jgi:hypothetical protein
MIVRAPKVITLGQSAAAVPHTGDTNEATLASITIPAGTIGNNGQLTIETQWTWTNNANNKTPRVKLGGSTIYGLAHTATAGLSTRHRIANRNAANNQVSINAASDNFYGGSAAAATYSVDTSQDVTLTITGQCANAADTITLESYQVVLFK